MKKYDVLLNPADCNNGDIIQSYYSGVVYKVVEANKKGKSKLQDISNGFICTFNAHNNRHFEKNKVIQLRLL